MKFNDLLNECGRIYTERAQQYGDAEIEFAKAAEIFNLITGNKLSTYDLQMAMVAVKLSRIKNQRLKTDTYVDLANYVLLAGESLHLPSPTVPIDVPKKLVTKPVVSTEEMEALEAGIKEMAQKLAPEKKA